MHNLENAIARLNEDFERVEFWAAAMDALLEPVPEIRIAERGLCVAAAACARPAAACQGVNGGPETGPARGVGFALFAGLVGTPFAAPARGENY